MSRPGHSGEAYPFLLCWSQLCTSHTVAAAKDYGSPKSFFPSEVLNWAGRSESVEEALGMRVLVPPSGPTPEAKEGPQLGRRTDTSLRL